jgi:hypothetical protein
LHPKTSEACEERELVDIRLVIGFEAETVGKAITSLKAGQNLTVRFQINLVELEEFGEEGAIAFLKAGQNLTVRFLD